MIRNQGLPLGIAGLQDWVIWGWGPSHALWEQSSSGEPDAGLSGPAQSMPGARHVAVTDIPRHCPGESMTHTDKKNLPKFPHALPFIHVPCVPCLVTMLLDV